MAVEAAGRGTASAGWPRQRAPAVSGRHEQTSRGARATRLLWAGLEGGDGKGVVITAVPVTATAGNVAAREAAVGTVADATDAAVGPIGASGAGAPVTDADAVVVATADAATGCRPPSQGTHRTTAGGAEGLGGATDAPHATQRVAPSVNVPVGLRPPQLPAAATRTQAVGTRAAGTTSATAAVPLPPWQPRQPRSSPGLWRSSAGGGGGRTE